MGQFAYPLCLSHCYLWHLLQEWLKTASYTHTVISDYRTLRKGSSAQSLKSLCIRYSLPTPMWNAAKFYGCFTPEWENPHGRMNFSWFALTFLNPSMDTDLICILPTLPFLPLQVSVSGFCMSAIRSTIPIPVFFLLILSAAVTDCIGFFSCQRVGGEIRHVSFFSACLAARHMCFCLPHYFLHPLYCCL